jgi:hypothetical protein
MSKWTALVSVGESLNLGFGKSPVMYEYRVDGADATEAHEAAVAAHLGKSPHHEGRTIRVGLTRLYRYAVTFRDRKDKRRRETLIAVARDEKRATQVARYQPGHFGLEADPIKVERLAD